MIAFIFARGGSKGLPNKNLLEINGESLLSRTIGHARDSEIFSKIIVSTDSKEIASKARSAGAQVPFMRPSELATDTSPEIHSWKHAINFIRETGNLETFVALPVTCPLRTPQDIIGAVRYFQENQFDLVITGHEARKNPYFNLVEMNHRGFAEISKPNGKYTRRQDAPKVFEVGMSAFVASADYIIRTDHILEGKIGVYEIRADRAIDIDTQIDFDFAEFMLQNIEGTRK